MTAQLLGAAVVLVGILVAWLLLRAGLWTEPRWSRTLRLVNWPLLIAIRMVCATVAWAAATIGSFLVVDWVIGHESLWTSQVRSYLGWLAVWGIALLTCHGAVQLVYVLRKREQ